ncbi:MAG: ABC transporter permease [Acidobacteriota bacterium]
MSSFIVRRLASALLLLVLILTLTFFLIHLAPGEPARLFENPHATAESQEEIRRLYGWDRPLHEQYGRWLGAVLTGDWGVSFTQRRPVFELLIERLPATALLVLTGVTLEHLLGLWMGVTAARRPGGRFDVITGRLALILHAVPAFVLGLLMIEWLAIRAPIFPPQHMTSVDYPSLSSWGRVLDIAHHLVLPALVLALVRFGAVVRFVRSGLLDVLGCDFIRTARAKGLPEWRVLWIHAVPNTLGPLIQRLGVSLPRLLSGTVILEVVFAWPGLGTAVYAAILQRDYPVVLAATALSGVLVLGGSLLADVAHAWLDPRVRDHYV